MESEEKLRRAILKILNISSFKIFGCLIYNFQINILKNTQFESDQKNAKDQLTACTYINNKKPYIEFYEDFINEHSIEELEFILLHEILHILDGDSYRIGTRNPIIFNLASDHVINTALKKATVKNEIPTKLPHDTFIIPELEHKDLTKEEVYEYLLKNGNFKKIGTWNDDYDITEATIKNHSQTVISDIKKSTDHKTNESEKDISETLKAEARVVQNTIGRGDHSGALSKLISQIIEIKIPWSEIVLSAIATIVTPKPDLRSWRNIRKRFYAHNIIMPGDDFDLKPGFLIIGVDTSGSIQNQELKKFGGIILQSANNFDLIRVIKHDVEIQDDQTITAEAFETSDVCYNFKGRGGTSHRQIFNKIENAYIENVDISMVILLTDFESDIPKIWNEYKWHKNVPLKIILNTPHEIPSYIDKKPIVISQYE